MCVYVHMNEARFSHSHYTSHNNSSYAHTVRTIPTNSGVSRHRVAHPTPNLTTSGSPRHRITAIFVAPSVSHHYEGKRTSNAAVRRAEGKSESKRVGQKVRAVAQPYRVKIATWDRPEPMRQNGGWGALRVARLGSGCWDP